MRFGKNKQYYYKYNSYGSPAGRHSHVNKKKVLLVAGAVVLILGILVAFNFKRIQLMSKGYSFNQQNVVLSLDKEDVNTILSKDKIDHIEIWAKESKKADYYDKYEKYYNTHKKEETYDIILFVDNVFDNYAMRLEPLGYKDDVIWDVLKDATLVDLDTIIQKKYTYETIKPYLAVNGFKVKNMEEYVKVYKEKGNYNYAVLSVSYPAIISSNESADKYTIQNPESMTVLVKKGFELTKEYEPGDLVEVSLPTAQDDGKPKLRKEASEALTKMFNDASDEGYHLVINSSYRSYKQQQAIYKQFEDKYGGIYAKEHVADPGCSDHQTGLGLDLTSESVVNGERLVFGDSSEYKWAIENAHKYGFVLRYPNDTSNLTGIVNEPWHFRYVGTAAAEKIHQNNWTLEEYCLYEGVLPQLEDKV